MPNHVSNLIEVPGDSDAYEGVRSLLVNDEGRPDFNLLIPMPPDGPDFIASGGISLGETKPNWYGWSCEHWGTKWNAYDGKVGDQYERRIYFETAWSVPNPVVKKLAEKTPGAPWTWYYADEDTGHNYGVFRWDGSVLLVEVEPHGKGTETAYFWAQGVQASEGHIAPYFFEQRADLWQLERAIEESGIKDERDKEAVMASLLKQFPHLKPSRSTSAAGDKESEAETQ